MCSLLSRFTLAVETVYSRLPLPQNSTFIESTRNFAVVANCPFQIDNQTVQAVIAPGGQAILLYLDESGEAISDSILSFRVTEEVFRRAQAVNTTGREGLCTLPQSLYVAYRDSTFFNDPSLGDDRRVASGVILAQVGIGEIRDLDQKVRATFQINADNATLPTAEVRSYCTMVLIIPGRSTTRST